MMMLWEDSLGTRHIDLNDDFFSLGGHSLLGLNLIEKINQEFYCSLHPNQLHKTPTIKSLIEQIEQHSISKLEEMIVPLKIKDNNSPILFLFHPINGLLFCFNTLLAESNLNVSIMGLQDPSISTRGFKYSSLKEIAQDYLKSILKKQPKGPFFFVGYSFGGNIGYEVAALLQQRGEQVALLGMIDSWAINAFSSHDKDAVDGTLEDIYDDNLIAEQHITLW